MLWRYFVLGILSVILVLLFSLKEIMAEYTLCQQPQATAEEVAWVNSYRGDARYLLRAGAYRFFIVFDAGETLDARIYFNTDQSRVMITGVLTAGDFVKDIHAEANYRIDGNVIDYHNTKGHITFFPEAGMVFEYNNNDKLVLRSKINAITSI